MVACIQHLTRHLVIPKTINQAQMMPISVVGKPERSNASHQPSVQPKLCFVGTNHLERRSKTPVSSFCNSSSSTGLSMGYPAHPKGGTASKQAQVNRYLWSISYVPSARPNPEHIVVPKTGPGSCPHGPCSQSHRYTTTNNDSV